MDGGRLQTADCLAVLLSSPLLVTVTDKHSHFSPPLPRLMFLCLIMVQYWRAGDEIDLRSKWSYYITEYLQTVSQSDGISVC